MPTPPMAVLAGVAGERVRDHLTEDHRHRQREDLRSGRGGVDGLGEHVEALCALRVVHHALFEITKDLRLLHGRLCGRACER